MQPAMFPRHVTGSQERTLLSDARWQPVAPNIPRANSAVMHLSEPSLSSDTVMNVVTGCLKNSLYVL